MAFTAIKGPKLFKSLGICALFKHLMITVLVWCFVTLPLVPSLNQVAHAEVPVNTSGQAQDESFQLFGEDGLDIAESHQSLWRQMQEFQRSIYGSAEEWEQAQAWIEENDFMDTGVFEKIGTWLNNIQLFKRSDYLDWDYEAKNPENWSLMTFLRVHYGRADQMKDENYLIPFAHPEVQKHFDQALDIKQQLERSLRDGSLSQKQKEDIVLAYTAFIDFSLQDVLMLFSYDNGSIEERRDMLSEIRYLVPRDWDFEQWQAALSEVGLLVTEQGRKQYVEMDTFVRLDRYLSTLAAMPFQPFYTKMIRLMSLSDMMGRLSMYKQILKDDAPIQIPQACQTERNFSFPAEMQFDMMTEPERRHLMDGILSRNGLLTTTYEAEFQQVNEYIDDYILNYDSPSLDYDGFAPQRPFERYLSADYATSHPVMPYTDEAFYDPMGLHGQALQSPMIDHTRDLPIVLGGAIAQFLRKEVKNHRLSFIQLNAPVDVPLISPHDPWTYLARRNMAIMELAGEKREDFEEQLTGMIQKIVSEVPVDRNESGHLVNEYLFEKLQAKNLDAWSWEDLLSQETVEALENNVVSIDQMPPLHAPESWRRWAFEKLYDLADKMVNYSDEWTDDERFFVNAAFVESCQYNPWLYICQDSGAESVGVISRSGDHQQLATIANGILVKVKDVLHNYAYRGDYHPLVIDQRFLEDEWQKSYLFFQEIWLRLKDFEEHYELEYLEGTNISEIEYLYSIAEKDLVASMRLSYLLYQQEEYPELLPQTRKSLDNFFDFLKLNRPLHPYWANQVLTKDQQQFMWAEIKREENQNSGFLLNRKMSQNPEQEFYHMFEWLELSNFFDGERTDKALQSISQNLPAHEARQEIASNREVLGDSQYNIFQQIYQNPGDIDRNIQLLQRVQQEEGLNTERALKSYIYQWDINIRAPLYYHTLMEAAFLRRDDIQENIQTICELDEFGESKIMDMRKLHSMSHVMQRKAAELFSATLPKTVEKGISRWVQDDKKAFFWGIGAGLMIVAAGIATTALGMPLLGLAIGVGSLGMNAVSIHADLRQFIQSKRFLNDTRILEELGYANADEAKQYFMKTPGIAIMGILFTIPDIGIIRTSARMLSALNFETYLRSFLHKGAKATRRNLTRFTAKILSLEEVAENILETSGKVGLRHARRESIQKLTQELGTNAVARGGIDEAVSVVNGHASRVISELYGNNMNRFAKSFLNPYGNKLTRRIYRKSFQKNQRKYQRIMQAIRDLSQEGSQNTRSMRRWQAKKMRLESKKLQIEAHLDVARKLQRLSESVFEASAENLPLDQFLRENMDDLGDVIPFIRPRVRDLPSYVFQGLTPNRTGRLPGIGQLTSRAPFLAGFSDYDLVKKLFLARNQLVSKEAMERAARELGVERRLAHQSYFTMKKAYANLNEVAQELMERSPEEALDLFERAYDFEGEILNRVKQELQKKGNWSRIAHKYDDWSIDILREVFRKGDDLEFITLFNSLDPEKVYSVRTLQQTAHQTARSLAQQMEQLKHLDPKKSVESLFTRYIKSLEILSIHQNTQLMEHMF
jgi:hypothetical protein